MGCNSTLDQLPTDTWRKIFGAHSCLVAFTASIENFGVLLLLHRSSRQQTPSNRIMTSLVFADFLTGSFLAPLYAVQYFNVRLLHNCAVESIRRYLTSLLVGASTFTLGFISYDRCLHLIKRGRYCMKHKVLYPGILLCWLIPFLWPLLRLTSNTEDTYSVTIILSGALILTIIIGSYLSVALSLRKFSKHCSIKKRSQEKERKTAVTVVMIITLYILMIVPCYIYLGLFVSKCFDQQFLSISYSITKLMAVTNSCVNPIVYCYRTAKMRSHIRRIFRAFRPNISNKVSSDVELQKMRNRRMTRVSRVSNINC